MHDTCFSGIRSQKTEDFILSDELRFPNRMNIILKSFRKKLLPVPRNIFIQTSLTHFKYLSNNSPETFREYLGLSGLSRKIRPRLNSCYMLAYFMPLVSFCTPLKHNKISGFLFLWGTDWEANGIKWINTKIKLPLNTCYIHNATDKIFFSNFSLPNAIAKTFCFWKCYFETSLRIAAKFRV